MDDETVKEGAKAVQEVAKTTGQAIDLTKGLTGWIGEAVGRPLAEAIGLFVTDRIQATRFERAIYDKARLMALAEKLGAIFDPETMAARAIPPKVALPLLEAASMEYDDELQSLWAHLLATAMNADEAPVEKQFVSILAELSAEDAKALAALWIDSFAEKNLKEHVDGPVTYKPSVDTTPYGEQVAANLTRLGLITASTVELNLWVPNRLTGDQMFARKHPVGIPGEFLYAVFTDLGRAFCRAVGMREPQAN